jgi:hypothetical protein
MVEHGVGYVDRGWKRVVIMRLNKTLNAPNVEAVALIE